ncbi:MAG: flagellar assembly peptidoglycan hydrolase FlgJ [Proteobacteria bacterium]|nr:flagellar assembly peptidoglycan hydrolase FlgJ [Pseudomonadota bacterium]
MSSDILKTQAPAFTDIAGLSKLKRAAGANDPQAIRTVAEQFEAMFTRMMLKSMRDAVGKDPMFGSDQQEMYQGMADDELSVQLAKGKGLGLADMLVRQLQKMGVKGAHEAAGADAKADSAGTSGTAGGLPIATTGSRGYAIGATGPRAYAIGPAGSAAKAAAAYRATQQAAPTPTTSATSDATKSHFIQDLWPQAQDAGTLLGVDPRHLIAQAALETNWGQSLPQDASGRSSNNLFGMKASSDWTGGTVTNGTQEFANGVASNTTAQFKAYATPTQSFQDYVALLRNNHRYSAALNTGSDVHAFATALQRGGYATDPDYANKIAAVANTVGNLKLSSTLPIPANAGTL